MFEAYVFSLVVRAAQIEGAEVAFRNVDGTRTASTFVFRTSPGDIYSTARNYSHAVIAFPDRPTLEAHLGVYVAGKSRVRHEMDVSVLLASEAHMCRQERVLPRPRAVELAVECKFYAGAVSLNLARAFVGLGSDLSTKNHYFVINNTSTSAEWFLAGRDKLYCSPVVPVNGHVVDRLRTYFQDAFVKFKDKNW